MASLEEDECHGCSHRIGENYMCHTDHSIRAVLELNYKGLRHFPAKLTRDVLFYRIKRLYMKMNMLTSLPEDIGNMSGLVELYLPHNQLKDLPEGLSELKKLQNLNISNNFMSDIPSVICQLPSLRKLQISGNRLTSIPSEIGNLEHLSTLEAMDNQLRDLPEELARCSQLSSLMLDKNQVTRLPNQLCQLHYLSEISLCGNNLHILPQDLGNQPHLKAVNVDDNRHLQAIPASICQKQCGIHGCGRDPVPLEIANLYPCLEFWEDGEEVRQRILLPSGLRTLGNSAEGSVVTLLELTFRRVYSIFLATSTGKQLLCEEMPKELFRILTSLACHCDYCGSPMFVTAYPIVLKRQISDIYILSLCCSIKCSRLYKQMVDIPVIYPYS